MPPYPRALSLHSGPGGQEVYRDLLAEQAAKARLAVWAYCLMPNHVYIIVGARG